MKVKKQIAIALILLVLMARYSVLHSRLKGTSVFS